MTWALALRSCASAPAGTTPPCATAAGKAGPAGPYGILPAAELAGQNAGRTGLWRDRPARGRHRAGPSACASSATRARCERSTRASGVEFVGLDELFARADVLSLHCPATPDTKGVVNARTLALMRPGRAHCEHGARRAGGRGGRARRAVRREAGRLCRRRDGARAHPRGQPAAGRAEHHPDAAHRLDDARGALARLSHEVCENLRAFLQGEMRNIVNG